MESKKAKKQRKKQAVMPLNQRKKLLSANLAKELRESTGKRSLPVRKGDTVKIMRGKNKGKEGKISAVDMLKTRVNIEKIIRKKVDGTEIPIPISPNNLQITVLNKEDERRLKRQEAKK